MGKLRRGTPSIDEGLTETLVALAAAGVAVWRWRPASQSFRLSGAVDAAGLASLAPDCAASALRALSEEPDAEALLALGEVKPPGTPIRFTLRLEAHGSEPRRLLWQGAWLEDGEAAGTVQRRGPSDEAIDALTGLLSRNGFLNAAAERLARSGSLRLLAADVARLRRLNEALGPDGADLVLKALALRLSACFPSPSILARVGEDEFVALIADEGPQREAAGRLRQALEKPLRVKGFDIHPTLWVAECRCEGGAGAPGGLELLRRSSLALEAARQGGQSLLAASVRSSTGDGLTRLALESDLHGALERGEIMPYYQPIAHLGTGRLAGFEALARWRHPVRGLVLPEEFLPLMAEAGLMIALGRHMLTAAAAQIGAWRRAHPEAGELFVAVNLSTGELDDERLVSFVAQRVKENALAPRALKVEITESDVMRDPERAAVVLAELREAGAGISLDDFGTGFSSLAYLTRLPFETLKIDRYFVRTMAEHDGSAKIVRSVASLGRDLGLEVVAEGVETLASARQLHAMGCEYGQGYGYAPALDAQAAEVYLNESYLDDVAPIRVSA